MPLVARRRERHVAQVVAAIEVRIVGPLGQAQVERHREHALTQARHERDGALERRAEARGCQGTPPST